MHPANNWDLVMLNDLTMQNITVLEVETKALRYTRAHYIYHGDLGVKLLQHTYVADCAFTSGGSSYQALS